MLDSAPLRDDYHALTRQEILPLVPQSGGTLLDLGGGIGATAAWLKANGGGSSGGGAGEIGELPDELPDPDGEEADMSKPVQVFILMGQSNMLGFGSASSSLSSCSATLWFRSWVVEKLVNSLNR